MLMVATEFEFHNLQYFSFFKIYLICW